MTSFISRFRRVCRVDWSHLAHPRTLTTRLSPWSQRACGRDQDQIALRDQWGPGEAGSGHRVAA